MNSAKLKGAIRRARSTKGLDAKGLQQVVAGPGIDPRINLSLAIVLAQPDNSAIVMDLHEGPLVDIMLMPSEQVETARVPAEFVSAAAGNWRGLSPDDEVLVALPMGDPNEGPVVIARLFNASQVPSLAMQMYPSDQSDTLAPKQNRRFIANGGTFQFCKSPSPSQLNPGQAALRGTLYTANEQSFVNALGDWLSQAIPALGAIAPNTIASGVELLTMLGQFQAGFPSYLSEVVFLDDPGTVPNTPKLQSISVTPSSVSLSLSDTQALAANGTFDQDPPGTMDVTTGVTWTSSDPSIATVNPLGLVTAVADGTATITASFGGISGTCAVTVSG